MSFMYHKHSIVSGRDAAGNYDNASRKGHISVATALAIAGARGWTQKVELSHHVSDLSGKGRGFEKRFAIDMATRAAAAPLCRTIDDSTDVHALYDELEGQ